MHATNRDGFVRASVAIELEIAHAQEALFFQDLEHVLAGFLDKSILITAGGKCGVGLPDRLRVQVPQGIANLRARAPGHILELVVCQLVEERTLVLFLSIAHCLSIAHGCACNGGRF